MADSPAQSRPVLITEAAPSQDDQLAARQRKYMIMMVVRGGCVIAGVLCYQIWWLALLLLALSVPLPWMAVLIANDRPPKKAERVSRFRRDHRRLESREHTVIDQ
ncbi:DUF3099 domain-containing protein [Actinoalloteichus spitiensis]|uniref:DUF3099 domain-containing protein n=1 Tax=Actinoalloteichus spitiensis TaxID=252394 RepID=UPI000319669F|nr:DUF3099 domain-containing protein [Actinoalloteichus spitiensis]